MRSPIAGAILILADKALGASDSSSYTDPIENFCQRLWHQCWSMFAPTGTQFELTIIATVKNDTLFIDGGLEVFVPKNNGGKGVGTPIVGSNEHLIAVDMSASWNWKTNISITAYNKTENQNTGTLPPNNIRGALYAGADDDPDLYLYGGTVSWANRSFPGFQWPTAATYSLWGYGTSDKTWDQYDVSLNVPNRPAGGAPAEVPGRGLAFYLGGFVNNGSSSDYARLSPDFKQYLNGLVVLNTTSKEASNISTSSLENYPRAQGGLAYIPNLGSEGILVSVGGRTQNDYVPFSTVDFFDIASIDHENSTGTWYTQTTAGDIPDPRTDFCVVAVSAPDNSSHNIYMYGGKGEYGVFDQTYVLSLPSFRWIRLLEGESPRYGHTCHLVGNSQMLTVGGARYENVSKRCDWEVKSVAILNLNDTTWGSVFAANAGKYTVPSAIYRVIGGSTVGNATETQPPSGFSNNDVAVFFNQPRAVAEKPSDHQLRGGGIAGVVVGSVAGAGIVAAGLAVLLVHRKRKQKSTAAGEEEAAAIESQTSPGNFTSVLFRNRGRNAELDAGSQRHEMESPVPHEMEARVPYEMDGRGVLAELPGQMSEEKKDAI